MFIYKIIPEKVNKKKCQTLSVLGYALASILVTAVMLCSSAEANSVGLNAAISGLRILSGSSVFYPEADVDGNQKVEMNDVILALQITAEMRGGFPDIVLAVADSMNSIKLAWLPAGVNYEVHLSEQDNFEPSPATLKKTVSTAQADIDGLESGKTYYVLIAAADSDGNKVRGRKIMSLTTLDKPLVISSGQSFHDAADLGLANPVITGTQYTYPKTATSTPPEVGSILMSADGLKKVTSVSVTADSIIIQTTDAELTQAVHQGSISNTLVMFEDSSNPTLSARQADGSMSKTMRWDDDLLVVEQKNFSEKDKRDSDQSAGVDITLGFEPEFQTDIDWEGDTYELVRLTKCRIVGKGTFNAGINAWYKFAASGMVSKEKEIFTRIFKSRYMLGSVPVYQETTLSVNAIFSASASAQIEANAEAKASTVVELGVEYNPNTGAWDKIFSSGFEKSVTVNMSVQGGVYGEVRLIPQIEVKFYKAVAGYLTLEPFLYGDIQAQANYYTDILAGFGYSGAQLTKCDFGLKAESYIGINLSAFKKDFSLLDKTKIWESEPWLLFSLPTLTASYEGTVATVNKAVSLTATVENGVNNPFNDSTVKWHVYPKTGGTVSGTGKTATFTPSGEGTYTLFFSGENKLGTVGRQFVKGVVIAVPNEAGNVKYRYHGIQDKCLNMKRCPDIPKDTDTCAGIPYDQRENLTCKSWLAINDYEYRVSTPDYYGRWDSATCDMLSYSFRKETHHNVYKRVFCYEEFNADGFSGQWAISDCKPCTMGNDIVFAKRVNMSYEGTVIFFNISGLCGFPPTPHYGEGFYGMLTYTGVSKNGPAGIWRMDNGRPVTYGDFVNDKKEGLWIVFHTLSETVYAKMNYTNDILNGEYGEWNVDGTPTGEHGNVLNNKKEGVWTYYCPDYPVSGKTQTITYVNGEEQSRTGSCN